MATLLSSQTTNGAGSGASHTAHATVFVTGTFDGADVTIQVSNADSDYVKADNLSTPNTSRLREPGCVNIAANGTYYIRCVVSNAGANTSISAVSTA